MFEQLGPDHFIAHRLNLDSRVLYYLTCRSRGWVDEKSGKYHDGSYSLLRRVIIIILNSSYESNLT